MPLSAFHDPSDLKMQAYPALCGATIVASPFAEVAQHKLKRLECLQESRRESISAGELGNLFHFRL